MSILDRWFMFLDKPVTMFTVLVSCAMTAAVILFAWWITLQKENEK